MEALFSGSVYVVKAKILLEIEQGTNDTMRNDNIESYVHATRILLDLLEELEDEDDRKKIEVFENPMGSLYYEEVKEED